MLPIHRWTMRADCLVDMYSRADHAAGYEALHGLPRHLCDFELNRPTSLPLNNASPFAHDLARADILCLQADEVASATLAVYCEIEEHKIS
jgi:hypothetical protein